MRIYSFISIKSIKYPLNCIGNTRLITFINKKNRNEKIYWWKV